MDNFVDVNDLAILFDYWLSECYEEYFLSAVGRLSAPVRGEIIQICTDKAIERKRRSIIMDQYMREKRKLSRSSFYQIPLNTHGVV